MPVRRVVNFWPQLNVSTALLAFAASVPAVAEPPTQTGGSVQRSVVLPYEAKTPPLPEPIRQLLAQTVAELLPACPGWPAAAQVRIRYDLAVTTPHRTDYQAIGARTEALRTYFREAHGLARLSAWIEMESRVAEPLEQDTVKVTLQCWR